MDDPKRRAVVAFAVGLLVLVATRLRGHVEVWLNTPVPHVRDLRSEFLLKLAVLHRHGRDATALVDAQRRELAPIVAALRAEQDRAGRAGDGADEFDRMLAAWRRTSAEAALAFLDEL